MVSRVVVDLPPLSDGRVDVLFDLLVTIVVPCLPLNELLAATIAAAAILKLSINHRKK